MTDVLYCHFAAETKPNVDTRMLWFRRNFNNINFHLNNQSIEDNALRLTNLKLQGNSHGAIKNIFEFWHFSPLAEKLSGDTAVVTDLFACIPQNVREHFCCHFVSGAAFTDAQREKIGEISSGIREDLGIAIVTLIPDAITAKSEKWHEHLKGLIEV